MKRSPTVLLTALCLPLLAALGLMFFAPMPLRAQQSSAGSAIPSALIPSTSIPIYAIQGVGLQSPYAEQWVDTYGLVTGVTDTGFYIQDPFGDDNDDSSDGIFVYTHSRPKVDVGKCVAIERAFVDEFYEKTELSRTKSPQPVDWCTGGADRSSAD